MSFYLVSSGSSVEMVTKRMPEMSYDLQDLEREEVRWLKRLFYDDVNEIPVEVATRLIELGLADPRPGKIVIIR